MKSMNPILTREQIGSGRLKALRNAEELIQDAECLYEAGRFPRALFLAQIAVEEAGKYLYLLSASVALAANRIKWPRFWKTVRSHGDKTTLFLMLEDVLVPSGAGPKGVSEHRRDAQVLERGKMWSLYADFEQTEFFTPSEVIEQPLVESALKLAKNRVRLARQCEDLGGHSQVIERMTADDVAAVEARMLEYLAENQAQVTGMADNEA